MADWCPCTLIEHFILIQTLLSELHSLLYLAICQASVAFGTIATLVMVRKEIFILWRAVNCYAFGLMIMRFSLHCAISLEYSRIELSVQFLDSFFLLVDMHERRFCFMSRPESFVLVVDSQTLSTEVKRQCHKQLRLKSNIEHLLFVSLRSKLWHGDSSVSLLLFAQTVAMFCQDEAFTILYINQIHKRSVEFYQ